MVSAGFVAALKSQNVLAVVILGDPIINGVYAFKYQSNIPGATHGGEVGDAIWDGHAWVLIGVIICDLPVFRTAYGIQQPNNLKAFITRYFGESKGAMMFAPDSLPPEMEFILRFALNDDQIYGVLEGLSCLARAAASIHKPPHLRSD